MISGGGKKSQNESANPITINEDNVNIFCPPLNIRRAAPAGISGTDGVVIFVVYAENKTINIHLNKLKIVVTRGEWTEKLIVLFDVVGSNNRINLRLNSDFRIDVVDQGVRCNFLANHYYNTNNLYNIARNIDIRNEHGKSFFALAGFIDEYNSSNQTHYYIDGVERGSAEVNHLMSLPYS